MILLQELVHFAKSNISQAKGRQKNADEDQTGSVFPVEKLVHGLTQHLGLTEVDGQVGDTDHLQWSQQVSWQDAVRHVGVYHAAKERHWVNEPLFGEDCVLATIDNDSVRVQKSPENGGDHKIQKERERVEEVVAALDVGLLAKVQVVGSLGREVDRIAAK